MSDPSYRKELQLPGLAESARDVLELLREEEEIRKIPTRNIVLGGLSQGCAMSLSVLLSLDNSIGRFFGMCGYLKFQNDIYEAAEDTSIDEDDPFFEPSGGDGDAPLGAAIKATVFVRDLLCPPPLHKPAPDSTTHETPIFLGHGSVDEKVPRALGEAMATTMRKADYKVDLKVYEGLGHWYKIPEEIVDIVGFLRSTLGLVLGETLQDREIE